jgi:hypothetical protein
MRGSMVVAGFRAEGGGLRECHNPCAHQGLDMASRADLRLEISNYYCSRFKKQRNLGKGVKKQWLLKSVKFPHSCRSILINNQKNIQPSLETVQEIISASENSPRPPNLVPLCATIPSDFLTPETAYLKLSAKCGVS